MRETDITELGRQRIHDLSPKHRHFQDVSLIDRAEPATSLAGSLKGEATDTADLFFAVPIGIDPLPDTIGAHRNASGFTKIDPARELSDNQYIKA